MASSAGLQRRFLHTGHFAFMRAVVEGVEVGGAWELYLSTEGEASDLRRVKRTIAWIRTEFAAAAHRHRKPGTARLVLIDAEPDPGDREDDIAGRGLLDRPPDPLHKGSARAGW